MNTIKVHKRINQIFDVYYRLGIWRNEDESTIFRRTTWKLFYLIFFVSFPLCLVFGGLITDDKNQSVFLIATGMVVLVLAVKFAYMLWRKEKFRGFVLEIGTHSVADFEEFIKVNEKLKKLVKFSCGFLFMTTVGCGSEIVFNLPLFSGEKRLPLNMWFPFDWKNSAITYWAAYAFVATTIMISALTVSVDVIIWYLMMNCAIKYGILGNQFMNMGSRKLTSETEKQNFKDLIALIKVHERLQETTSRLKSCFENLFLIQITTSGICICGSVYALAFRAQDDDLVQATLNCVILFHNLFDILMLTYLGNEIKLSRDRLAYSLFESNWIEQSESFKKSFIVLIEVLKKPQELVIGKLFTVNLKTFSSILNFAYSTFNILKNLN